MYCKEYHNNKPINFIATLKKVILRENSLVAKLLRKNLHEFVAD